MSIVNTILCDGCGATCASASASDAVTVVALFNGEVVAKHYCAQGACGPQITDYLTALSERKGVAVEPTPAPVADVAPPVVAPSA